MGKSSFAFAYYMDRQEEHVNIAYTTKEFYTEVWHFTIIYAQVTAADVALIMIPCDCHFTTAIAKGNRKAGDMQGQTRQHSRCINLLCVKQIAIGCNKLDCDTAGYKITRYEDVSNEMKSMSVKVGGRRKWSRARFLSCPSLAG